MVSSFFKGLAQGMGIVFGILAIIMLMQISASILSKYGLIDGLEKKQQQLVYKVKENGNGK